MLLAGELLSQLTGGLLFKRLAVQNCTFIDRAIAVHCSFSHVTIASKLIAHKTVIKSAH